MKRRASDATDNAVHHNSNQQRKRKNKKRRKNKKAQNGKLIERPHTIVYEFSATEQEQNVPMIDSEPSQNDTSAMEDHLLSSLLFPQTKQWFMENVFRKKAFATQNAPSERTRALVIYVLLHIILDGRHLF